MAWTAERLREVGLVAYEWSDDPAADRREGLDAALRAIYLDEKNPYAHRAGLGCLNRFSASISGASTGVMPPCGLAAG
jgi:hypothetical protein